MVGKKTNFDQILHFLFLEGKDAKSAHASLMARFVSGVPSERTCRRRFSAFRRGEFPIQRKVRSPPRKKVSDEKLEKKIKANRRLSSRRLGKLVGMSHRTILVRAKQLGFEKKKDRVVPHRLGEKQKAKRKATCEDLLEKHKKVPFLNNLITSDEKWVFHDARPRGASWLKSHEPALTVPKKTNFQKKVLFCVWWDRFGLIYSEFLPPGETINADLYCKQLEIVAKALKKKRSKNEKYFFLHDNARSHTAKKTKEKMKELDFEVLPHPPYSPDLAPSDFHLFRSLQHSLDTKLFDENEKLKRHVLNFFASKPNSFFANGISVLPSRWQSVVDADGEYFDF